MNRLNLSPRKHRASSLPGYGLTVLVPEGKGSRILVVDVECFLGRDSMKVVAEAKDVGHLRRSCPHREQGEIGAVEC